MLVLPGRATRERSPRAAARYDGPVILGFALRCSVECRACRISIPLNGLVRSARCYHCGEVNTFSEQFWTTSLGRSVFDAALGMASLERRRETAANGFLVEFGHQPITCPRCDGAPIDGATLGPVAAAGAYACAQCGATVRVRVADALALALHPTARHVVAETAPDAAAQALQSHAKPVVFQCMSCGGGLEVAGAKRLVSCQFCNADNYLPDGLWQILRPVPKPELFYLACEVESSDERRARAARLTLRPEELASLACDVDKLVRRAIAQNPTTPPELLKTLARDASRTVLEGLAENPNLPDALLESMAASEDEEFRFLAARNPRLPHARLLSLAEDPRPRVAEAAHARVEELRAQGVAIGGVKGFFAKLFS